MSVWAALLAALALLALTACETMDDKPDAAAQAACEHWERHVDRIFAPETTVGERQELVDEFRDKAAESEMRRFSQAVERIATDTRAGLSRPQRDFDEDIDLISEVCGLPTPTYPARELP